MDCKYKILDLLLFEDGVMDKEETEIFENHLKECNPCQKELREHNNLAAITRMVFDNYSRPNCPDVETMVNYYGRDLGENKVTEIEDHVADCELCQVEYVYFLDRKVLPEEVRNWKPTPEFHAKIMARLEKIRRKTNPN